MTRQYNTVVVALFWTASLSTEAGILVEKRAEKTVGLTKVHNAQTTAHKVKKPYITVRTPKAVGDARSTKRADIHTLALPPQHKVVKGRANVIYSRDMITVDAQSKNTVIFWPQGMDIPNRKTIQINHQGKSHVSIHKIGGGKMTQWAGTLAVNKGHAWLENVHGFYLHNSVVLQGNGHIGLTTHTSPLHPFSTCGKATIVDLGRASEGVIMSEGDIDAASASLNMVAPYGIVDGTVRATAVKSIAGGQVAVTLDEEGLVAFEVSGKLEDSLIQMSAIDAGVVGIHIGDAEEILDGVVHLGPVRATKVIHEGDTITFAGGEVTIDLGPKGRAEISQGIDASGTKAGGRIFFPSGEHLVVTRKPLSVDGGGGFIGYGLEVATDTFTGLIPQTSPLHNLVIDTTLNASGGKGVIVARPRNGVYGGRYNVASAADAKHGKISLSGVHIHLNAPIFSQHTGLSFDPQNIQIGGYGVDTITVAGLLDALWAGPVILEAADTITLDSNAVLNWKNETHGHKRRADFDLNLIADYVVINGRINHPTGNGDLNIETGYTGEMPHDVTGTGTIDFSLKEENDHLRYVRLFNDKAGVSFDDLTIIGNNLYDPVGTYEYVTSLDGLKVKMKENPAGHWALKNDVEADAVAQGAFGNWTPIETFSGRLTGYDIRTGNSRSINDLVFQLQEDSMTGFFKSGDSFFVDAIRFTDARYSIDEESDFGLPGKDLGILFGTAVAPKVKDISISGKIDGSTFVGYMYSSSENVGVLGGRVMTGTGKTDPMFQGVVIERMNLYGGKGVAPFIGKIDNDAIDSKVRISDIVIQNTILFGEPIYGTPEMGATISSTGFFVGDGGNRMAANKLNLNNIEIQFDFSMPTDVKDLGIVGVTHSGTQLSEVIARNLLISESRNVVTNEASVGNIVGNVITDGVFSNIALVEAPLEWDFGSRSAVQLGTNIADLTTKQEGDISNYPAIFQDNPQWSASAGSVFLKLRSSTEGVSTFKDVPKAGTLSEKEAREGVSAFVAQIAQEIQRRDDLLDGVSGSAILALEEKEDESKTVGQAVDANVASINDDSTLEASALSPKGKIAEFQDAIIGNTLESVVKALQKLAFIKNAALTDQGSNMVQVRVLLETINHLLPKLGMRDLETKIEYLDSDSIHKFVARLQKEV